MPNHLIADIPVKALIRKDDKILLIQQADGKEDWCLPGGRLNNGEQPREGLRREILEEIGAEIEIGRLVDCTVFTSKSGMNHFVVVFEATLVGNSQPKPDGVEIKDVKWVTLEEALKMELRSEYRVILEGLAARIK